MCFFFCRFLFICRRDMASTVRRARRGGRVSGVAGGAEVWPVRDGFAFVLVRAWLIPVSVPSRIPRVRREQLLQGLAGVLNVHSVPFEHPFMVCAVLLHPLGDLVQSM